MPMPRGLRTAHGTRSRYQGTKATPGCRCDECRDAAAVYQRNLRHRGRDYVRPYNRRQAS